MVNHFNSVVPEIIYTCTFTRSPSRDAKAPGGQEQVKEQDHRMDTQGGFRKQ